MSNEMISVTHWAEIEAAIWGAFADGGKEYRGCTRERLEELRDLLAKPAEQRQDAPEGYKYRLKSKNRAWTYSANRPEFAEEEFEILPLYTRRAEQPAPVAVVLPVDWQDQLFAEMDRRFELRKLDEDHMANDDTQIGVEFAMKWVADRLDEVARLNPPQQ